MWFQLHHMRSRLPDSIFPLLTTPFFAIVFLTIVRHAGRSDLDGYALLAPVLVALWWISLFEAGHVVAGDRALGTLEGVVAAPVSFPAVVLGRILVVTLAGLVSFGEVLLVALPFGATVAVHHPGAFALTLVVTAFAMAGTAVVMSALFVLTRSSVTWGNSLSYPFYVLGGVLVPVAYLPVWIRPLSTGVFLSWSADLLRATLATDPIARLPVRLAMVGALGSAGYGLGALLLECVIRRVRRDGTLERA
jgi:ABC-2 type transport system permease protein